MCLLMAEMNRELHQLLNESIYIQSKCTGLIYGGDVLRCTVSSNRSCSRNT